MTAPNDTHIVLTGIKPTGRPHLGNYLGTIRPALELARLNKAFYFIADAHALTSVQDPQRLRDLIDEIAATWLALGLDPGQVVFYRQSAVVEIFELAWVLACSTSKGLLNRGHAYKAAVERNQAAEREPDAEIHAGLYTYPILMAADILAMDADLVPVGQDQLQHVEMARDIAEVFNRTYGPALKLPAARITEPVRIITGLDGRKMSKSYNNIIPVICSPEELRPLVMRIVTDSRRPEEPKDPEDCNLFALYRHFAPLADVARMRERYLNGGVAYKDVKEELHEVLVSRFAPVRERFTEIMADRPQLARWMAAGSAAAREQAARTLTRVRQAVGLQ
jgi:tryptophanyl-tRNA synthetase